MPIRKLFLAAALFASAPLSGLAQSDADTPASTQATTQTGGQTNPQANTTGAATAHAPLLPNSQHISVIIPRLTAAPTFEDFQDMHPHGAGTQMLHISDFTQTSPADGNQPTQKTDVYLGYDQTSLYVAWVCFDSEPNKVRAHMGRRENIYDDDFVEITLDTFHDQRHGVVFAANPLGVQADGLWTEGSFNNPDNSWDTVWDSMGRRTPRGYVVWERIPMRSLRFHGQGGGAWGITLFRAIARNGESDFWPYVSEHISGRLNQAATLTGIHGLESGHNMQFNPYGELRSFHALDTRDPANPQYNNVLARGKVGIDSKFIFHDSLVLDATINPDFAQVESDEPQNTINQRFEVFFPEKRPFFLENSNFFNVPGSSPLGGGNTTLVFTRRIADPEFGLRLTGKQGPFNLGFLVADDRAPGESVVRTDPDFHKRATFAIGRVTYDIGKHSSLGAIFTDREFAGDFNRVGGLDGNYQFTQHWNGSFHSVVSSTLNSTGYSFGQDHEAEIDGKGLRFFDVLAYRDITPNFQSETGFVRRTDIRHIQNYYHFYWKPSKKKLVLHGPEFTVERIWDHTNTGIEYSFNGDYVFAFRDNTLFAPVAGVESDTLRPQDFSGLPSNRKYIQDFVGLIFRASPNRLITWNTQLIRGGTIDLVVPAGQLPVVADETSLTQGFTVKPVQQLTIDNTYILDRVGHSRQHVSVFNNHIFRSKWNYQFNRELSARIIAQYNALLPNQTQTSLEKQKDLNFDFLLTYLVHPGTAFYLGYNSNLENVDHGLCARVMGTSTCDPNGSGLLRDPRGLLNDGKLVFVKVSYLFRR